MESKIINFCKINNGTVGICTAAQFIGEQVKCKFHDSEFSSPRCCHLHQNNSWCLSWNATEDARKGSN